MLRHAHVFMQLMQSSHLRPRSTTTLLRWWPRMYFVLRTQVLTINMINGDGGTAGKQVAHANCEFDRDLCVTWRATDHCSLILAQRPDFLLLTSLQLD
jgi:hypothetical protein